MKLYLRYLATTTFLIGVTIAMTWLIDGHPARSWSQLAVGWLGFVLFTYFGGNLYTDWIPRVLARDPIERGEIKLTTRPMLLPIVASASTSFLIYGSLVGAPWYHLASCILTLGLWCRYLWQKFEPEPEETYPPCDEEPRHDRHPLEGGAL